MKHKIKRLLEKRPGIRIRRRKDPNLRYREAVKELPRITNDTVAAHREEVLSGARKLIYPLQHPKHLVVIVSTTIFILGAVIFFVYCGLGLYRFQSTSGFLYDVTKVIPFPVAKAGPSFISYENYLFELRHRMHYYQTQQQVNFNDKSEQAQLDSFKQQAMQTVIANAYIKQLANQHHVSVSNQEVDSEIQLVKSQDRLGNNEKEFESVLNEFWGWSLNDFKRELKQQLLAEKVDATLDTSTQQKAQTALLALQHGTGFGAVASQYSDDQSTKANGGQFNSTITKDSQNLLPQTLNTLLELQPGQVSGIVNLGSALEIDKVISNNNGQIQAAHILFNFRDINLFIKPLQAKERSHTYIAIPQ